MPRAPAARRSRPPPRTPRVAPEARRRQLVERASAILTARGVEHLQITDVAAALGVSRPLIYRLFPTRQALVQAVLEDFTGLVNERFRDALVRTLPGTVEAIATAFVEASCDAIAERGAGPWRLLDARGVDPALAQIGRDMLAKLLGPWQEQLAGYLGASPQRAAHLLWVIVAAGRAALDAWIDGAISRTEAVEDATRAVSALLIVYTSPSA